jgi:hypothetical protein
MPSTAESYRIKIYDLNGIERGLFESSNLSTTIDLSRLSLYGNLFSWKIAACNTANICSNESAPFYFQFSIPVSVPTPPTGLSVQAAGASGYALTWNAVTDATYYKWEVSGQNLQNPITSTYWPSTRTLDLNLTAGGSYTWSGSSCNTAGCSNSVSTNFTTPNVLTPPVFSLTGFSPSVFTAPTQSGVAWSTSMSILGTSLDGVDKITWTWTLPSVGTTTWTKSSAGVWTNSAGSVKTVTAISSTQINATPTLVAASDTWRGTSVWTVKLCKSNGSVCESNNLYFTVSR